MDPAKPRPLERFERTHMKRSSGVFNAADLAGPIEESVEDGPVFRATMDELERGAIALKSKLRHIIRSAHSYIDRGKDLDVSAGVLLDAFKALDSLEPATSYLSDLFEKMREAQETFHNQLQNLLIDPLDKMYENDLKAMETQKANFDKESATFNQVLEKYLATDRDKKQDKLHKTDQKFLQKRTNYNLIRFDYLTFMEQLHTRKEKEVLYHVSSFVEKHANYTLKCAKIVDNLKPQRDRLNAEVTESWAEITNWLKERQELRNSIQKSSQDAAEKLIEKFTRLAAGSKHAKYNGIRDLATSESERLTGEVKQGFLFTRHNREWKKVWCVLSDGIFYEQLNWKLGSKSAVTVDLRTCTVKMALKAERRFCFEIISPQVKRIYQATSEEEAAVWIQTIQKAIETSLEHRISFQDLRLQTSNLDKDRVRRELMKDPSNECCADCGAKDPDWCAINLGILLCISCSGIHRSLGTHVSKIRSMTLDTLSWTPELIAVQRGLGNAAANSVLEYRTPSDAAVGATSPSTLSAPSTSPPVLPQLRITTPRGSLSGPASPPLDGRSPLVPPSPSPSPSPLTSSSPFVIKPPPGATREERQRFVVAKYVQRLFVEPLQPGALPNRELLQAIVANNLVGALRALMWQADINAIAPVASLHSASSSLADLPTTPTTPVTAADPQALQTLSALSVGTSFWSDVNALSSSSSSKQREIWSGMAPLHLAIHLGNPVMAEFLLQNGADVNLQDAQGNTPLHYAAMRADEAAVAFLLNKGARLDLRNMAGKRPLDVLPAAVTEGSGGEGSAASSSPQPLIIGLLNGTASSSSISSSSSVSNALSGGGGGGSTPPTPTSNAAFPFSQNPTSSSSSGSYGSPNTASLLATIEANLNAPSPSS